MLYVQQSLGPDEEIVHVGHFHWIYTLGAFMNIVWGIVGCIAILAAGVIFYRNFLEIGYNSWIEAVRALHPGIKLAGVLVFVFSLFKFAHMMIIKATTEIAITSSRLIYKRGLVARYVGEINIDRIEGINVLQGVLGRIMGYGRILIRGMGVGEVVLPPIADPISFRKAIEKAKHV